MAYSPTTWVDGTTPAINAANLNKMEQGIATADRSEVFAQTTEPVVAVVALWADTTSPQTPGAGGGGGGGGLDQATADARYVNVTGEETIEGPLIIDKAATSDRMLMIRTSASNRWFIGTVGGAESGSNAGSNFMIARFDDAGVWIDTVLSVNRATGVVSFPKGFAFTSQITAGSDINMNGFPMWGLPTPTNSSDAANKGYTDTKVALSGGTMTGELGLEEGAWTDRVPTDAYHVTNKAYVDNRTPKITVGTTAPSSPAVGDLWIDTN